MSHFNIFHEKKNVPVCLKSSIIEGNTTCSAS